MTTYNTGNPIGSTAVQDLYDNAENLDIALHTPETTWVDRLGKTRRSWAGSTGYELLGDYEAGITVTSFNQIIRGPDGEFWRAAAGTTLPYVTTGAGLPEGGAFVSVGDAALRQQLASTSGPDIGASLVGFRQLGAGAVSRDVLVKLREQVSVKDFGAIGDGVADDTAAIQAAINAASRIDFGDSSNTYRITKTIDIPSNRWLSGNGATINMVDISTGPLYGLSAKGGGMLTEYPLTTNGLAGNYTFSVADTAGLEVGDFVLLHSEALYPYGGGSYNVGIGEIKKIRSLTPTSITFTTPLLDSYLTVNLAAVHTLDFVENVHIKGLKIQGSNIAGRMERGIWLEHVNVFSVTDCQLDGQDIYQLGVSSCLYGNIERNTFRSAFYDGINGIVFYGIAIMDCSQWVNVGHNIGDRTRHLAITTARTKGQGHYGQPYFINVHHNHSYDSMAGGAGRSYAYEQHGFGRFILFDSNTAHGCYAGIRIESGRDIMVVNNVFKDYGYAGVILGGNGTLLKNILVANNLIDGYTGEIGGNAAGVRLESSSAQVTVKISGNSLVNTFKSGGGVGVSVGANASFDLSIENNLIDAGVDASTPAIVLASGVNNVSISGNKTNRHRGGASVSGSNCFIKGNVFSNTAAQASGFGLYSAGDRNVFQGNVCQRMNTAFRADTASSNNLFIDNQSVQCTSGTFSDAGFANLGERNYII